MTNRDGKPPGPKTAMTTIGGQLVLGERLVAFRRLYRWLNLTLIHQAVWPLLLLLAGAPAGTPDELPMPWYLARIGAPIAAALLALFYLRQHPEGNALLVEEAGEIRRPGLAAQVRVLLIGVPLMVAAARLVVGPFEPAAKVIAFGVADVLAFHLIHFGVVRRSYRDPVQALGLATLLFGLSWGLRDLLMTALGPDEASPMLALVSGTILGLLVAGLSRAIRAWPGGFWTAAATHWLLVYLIAGFV